MHGMGWHLSGIPFNPLLKNPTEIMVLITTILVEKGSVMAMATFTSPFWAWEEGGHGRPFHLRVKRRAEWHTCPSTPNPLRKGGEVMVSFPSLLVKKEGVLVMATCEWEEVDDDHTHTHRQKGEGLTYGQILPFL